MKLSIIISSVLTVTTFIMSAIPTEAKQMNKQLIDQPLSVKLPTHAKVIDLTQLLNDKTPTYGGETDEFKYHKLSTVDKDGYETGEFCMHEHFGTHLDAPIHFSHGAKTVDKLNPAELVLPLTVIDVRNETTNNPDYLLTVEKIKSIEKTAQIADHSAVLLLTGWDKHYFVNGKYRNADSKGVMHFPGFSLEAAQYLIEHHDIRALGIDTLSIDYGPSEDFAVHKYILGKGLFMVENLTNLDQLPVTGAVGIFAPLKIEGGTGSPARVLALSPH